MRSVFIMLLVLALPAPVASQSMAGPAAAGRISGSVISSDGRPLAAAAVTVRSASDSAIVTGAIADGEGRFQIMGLPSGVYLLRVSLIGHVPASLPPVTLAAGAAIATGDIVLEMQPVDVDAVEATVQRAPVVLAPDRTIYDVKDMPAADGGSAADVLRHVDELEVDFNGRVAMRGDRPSRSTSTAAPPR